MLTNSGAPLTIDLSQRARLLHVWSARWSVQARLIAAALGSGAIYGAYLLFVAFLPYDLGTPGVYLFDIMGDGAGALAIYILAIATLCALAATSWRAAQAAVAPSRGVLAWALVPPVIFALLLLCTLPLTSRDIFHYIMEGRTLSLYGTNPYLAPPSAFPDDPLLAFSNWDDYTSPYGPLWLLTSGGLTALAHNSLFWNIFLFKALAFLGYLACAALIWAILRASGRPPLAGTVFWLWNPLVLIEFPAAGHNDVLMLALLLGGLWLAISGRTRWAVAAIAAAAMVKSVAIIALPLVIWHVVAPVPRWWTRIVTTLLVVWPAALIVGATLGPFWAGMSSFGPLRESGFYYSSTGHILRIALSVVLGSALAGEVVRLFLAALLIAGYVLILRRTAGSPERVIRSAATTFLLMIALWPFLVPWYSAWAVAMVAAYGVRRFGWSVLLLCAGAQLSYLCQLYWPAREFVSVGLRSSVSALLYLGPFLASLLWLWLRERLVARTTPRYTFPNGEPLRPETTYGSD